MKSRSTQSVERLLVAEDPRSFLKVVFEARAASNRKLTYAALARLAGFSAKSYPRDVMLGKKFLKSESALAVAKGLKLNADLTEFFLLLVRVDNERREVAGEAAPKLISSLERARQRLRRKSENGKINGEQTFSITNISLVYASLGSPTSGASLDEIAARTKLNEESLVRCLDQMVSAGLAKIVDARFFAVSNNLVFDGMKNNGGFQKLFVQRLRAASKQAERNFESTTSLFFESTFSIPGHKLQEFKGELRELLNRFIEDRETPDGNSVASVSCAFFEPNNPTR